MIAALLAMLTLVMIPGPVDPDRTGCVFPHLAHHRAIVHLGSRENGPVGVFTSRFALLDAAHGEIESASRHLYFVRGGTAASVEDCSPKYGLVGVKMTEGPGRGRYGWVTVEQVSEYEAR